MALGGVGTYVVKLLGPAFSSSAAGRPLSKLTKPLCPTQVAGISSISLRDKNKATRPPPYPYKEKKYTFWNALFDGTTHRFDENSKLVVVEGPVAAGKTEFAKSLAHELDMLYMPHADMDMLYINEYGYDLRQLDPQLPESCRSFDVKGFCKNPNHKFAAKLQMQMLVVKYSQYVDALGHILSTGQGVVLDRCVYSDFVFVESMYKNGYLSKGARSVYYDVHANTMTELLKPHLVIYLDVPVAEVLNRIKKRNIPYEVNSKLFATPQYVSTMEELYKQRYLKEISSHAELLVYDWSNFGEVEVVVEDIERIDFDCFGKHDPKMKDWRMPDEWSWNDARMQYTTRKYALMNYFNVPRFDVPELMMDGHDAWQREMIWNSAPGMKYQKGYNADMGDKNILLKTKMDYRSTF